ncbi:MAG TPA: VOC family protein [Ktedonosporobacter sp.]|nr:VOC family protein [Ktedonosporobacter sp.]
MMTTDILNFTIIVRTQDEALQFYVEKLGFEKRMDIPMGNGNRWVTIAPRDAKVTFTLQPLDWFEGKEREERATRIGQSPTIVLQVDNCQRTYDQLSQHGVEFTEIPTQTSYDIEATLADLYGNTLVLLEQSTTH